MNYNGSPPLAPVFIVGCGRSGTTLLYDLLAGHPDLGWFSNNENRNPQRYQFAICNRLYKTFLLGSLGTMKYFPRPSEAYSMWDRFDPRYKGAECPPLASEHADAVNRAAMYMRIQLTMQMMSTLRFLNKNTRNTRRIGYLQALFPDAYFIHMIRDGRDVARSIVRIKWWRGLKLWWANGRTPEELVAEGMSESLTARRLWWHEVSQVRRDAAFLSVNQFMEVRYEELVRAPNETLEAILGFCGLKSSDTMQRHMGRFTIRPRVAGGQNPCDTADDEIGDLLRQLDYL